MLPFCSGNTGNEFYVAFMSNYIRERFRGLPQLIINDSKITIMTTELSGAVVMIESQRGVTTETVTPEQPATVSLKHFKVTSGADRNMGIKIKAEGMKKISVYTLNEELYSADTATVFPCSRFPSVSSYKYYAVSVPPSSNTHSTADSAFLIVACSHNTTVTITPTQTITHPYIPVLTIRAGTSFSVLLQERQTLYVQNREDLTGSKVVSSAPISFFTGHECGNVTADVSECDHLVEQIPPTITWGHQFIVAPTATRTANDIIKIVSSEGNTQVKMSCINSDTGNIERSTATITTSGSYHELNLPPNTHCFIETDKPAMVVQFTPGRSADGANADPFMVIVPALNQYLTNSTFTALGGFSFSSSMYANTFVSASTNTFEPSSIIFDGEPMTSVTWVSVPCYESGLTCGYATVTSLTNRRVHSVWSEDNETPIGVTVYGLRDKETFAYVGGLRLALPGKHFHFIILYLCKKIMTLGGNKNG